MSRDWIGFGLELKMLAEERHDGPQKKRNSWPTIGRLEAHHTTVD